MVLGMFLPGVPVVDFLFCWATKLKVHSCPNRRHFTHALPATPEGVELSEHFRFDCRHWSQEEFCLRTELDCMIVRGVLDETVLLNCVEHG